MQIYKKVVFVILCCLSLVNVFGAEEGWTPSQLVNQLKNLVITTDIDTLLDQFDSEITNLEIKINAAIANEDWNSAATLNNQLINTFKQYLSLSKQNLSKEQQERLGAISDKVGDLLADLQSNLIYP